LYGVSTCLFRFFELLDLDLGECELFSAFFKLIMKHFPYKLHQAHHNASVLLAFLLLRLKRLLKFLAQIAKLLLLLISLFFSYFGFELG